MCECVNMLFGILNAACIRLATNTNAGYANELFAT